MLIGVGITDFTFRTSQVALPLVVLAGTGSAFATGLVAGASGIPVLLSPWWTRRLRHRIVSGRAVAACYLVEAAALGAVALAATVGHLDMLLLAAAGLLLGSAEALDGPGRDALVADHGDRIGPDRALTLLTLRDFFRRLGMVTGPAVGGLMVARGHAVPLLWVEVVSILVSATLVTGVPAAPTHDDREIAGAIWAAVRGRSDVLSGWVVRGTGCALWFAFTLGLALLGVGEGRGGAFLAAGMTAYGVGSILGTLGVVRLLRLLPVLPSIVGAWAITGCCWIAIGRLPTMPVVVVAGVVSGLAIVVGNAGVTAQITRSSTGAERRTLMAGQSVVVNAASSIGLLVGGPALAAIGATRALELAGGVTVAVAIGCLLLFRTVTGHTKRPATSAARAPYPPPKRQACTSSGKSW
jgi:predicted MFS family arabinose efflux permease